MLSITDAESQTELIKSSFQQCICVSEVHTFVDIINEALRGEADESNDISKECDLDRSQVRAIMDNCHIRLVSILEGILYESIKYKVHVDCAHAARELCYGSKKPLEAILMVLNKIPEDADWSDTKSVGVHRDGCFQWIKATFGMKWSMSVGYPIMLERVRRVMESQLAAESQTEAKDKSERPAKRARVETTPQVLRRSARLKAMKRARVETTPPVLLRSARLKAMKLG